MLAKINLRLRIYIVLSALVFITIAGGLVMIWYTYRIEGLLNSIIDKNMARFQTTTEMAAALVNQKGFVTYYFLDGDPDWLRQLEKYRQVFRTKAEEALSLTENPEQAEAIALIESEYEKYITAKDAVIELYKIGKRETGASLHKEVRHSFFTILRLCEQYKTIQDKSIRQAERYVRSEAANLRIIAGISIFIIFILAALMAMILVRNVFSPIRRLIAAVNRDKDLKSSENVVKALSRGVYHLMEDMDVTLSELAKSRVTLVQSEKMAMVGKLAAGMAHSIRNPFTSVKMRLFSLGRSLELNAQQKADFDVISDEIRHVDAIVQNFLEFSRPPRLKMQSISPSAVTDTTIRLLKHRLKSYAVKIKVIRTKPLPDIRADPEQLKEVFVNIIINACEAMQDGGTIVIHEEVTSVPQLNKMAVIRLSDNGPGISDSIQTKIFEHFFTTKEEGTGLGLSIAKRIIEEHKGWLDMRSEENAGTAFVITLPLKE